MPEFLQKYSTEWKKLGNNQKLSLLILVFLVIVLPITLTLIIKPKSIFRPRAYPTTPPVTPPNYYQSSVLAVIFNDTNNNLELDNNEELVNEVDATVWVCKLDLYNYACDMSYPTGIGRLYYRSNFEILNIYPGLNEVWISSYNGYPQHWYTPYSKPVVINVSENKQYIALLPMSKSIYPTFPTKTPPSITPTPIACNLMGDANEDCIVNILDYVILVNNFANNTSMGPKEADFNRSGRVDGLDYAIWYINFGKGG